MDIIPIPPLTRRLDRDSAARIAVVLINPTLQDSTALTAPVIIKDAILIPAFRCRRFRDRQCRVNQVK